jgi:predicted SAM-dependent methyltransferase
MKIQILRDQHNLIEGYEHVIMNGAELNLSTFSNNECTEIIADNILDAVPIKYIAQTLKLLTDKLRMGGKLIIGGTDLRLFCKQVLNQAISPTDANIIVSECQSMTNLDEIASLVATTNLKIQTTSMNGIHFEICCTR